VCVHAVGVDGKDGRSSRELELCRGRDRQLPAAQSRRGSDPRHLHSASVCRHRLLCTARRSEGELSAFLQLRENWKKSGNLNGQGKVGGNIFLEKSGKMKNCATRCHRF